MLHMPINHPLAPVYRVFAGLSGLYVLAFGVVGLVTTWDEPLFSRADLWALGLRTNPAFAVLSILVGAAVLFGALIGGRIAHNINMTGGVTFLVVGVAMLGLMQTSLNLLNFSVATCIVSYLAGMSMLLSGLYDRVGTAAEAAAEEQFRHRQSLDHSAHLWTISPHPHPAPEQHRPEGDHRFA